MKGKNTNKISIFTTANIKFFFHLGLKFPGAGGGGEPGQGPRTWWGFRGAGGGGRST